MPQRITTTLSISQGQPLSFRLMRKFFFNRFRIKLKKEVVWFAERLSSAMFPGLIFRVLEPLAFSGPVFFQLLSSVHFCAMLHFG